MMYAVGRPCAKYIAHAVSNFAEVTSRMGSWLSFIGEEAEAQREWVPHSESPSCYVGSPLLNLDPNPSGPLSLSLCILGFH